MKCPKCKTKIVEVDMLKFKEAYLMGHERGCKDMLDRVEKHIEARYKDFAHKECEQGKCEICRVCFGRNIFNKGLSRANEIISELRKELV